MLATTLWLCTYCLLTTDCLGFAEICVSCDLTVAHDRNRRRQIPIPDSTITSMERSLELPEPSSHGWEKRSHVLFNNSSSREGFLTEGLSVTNPIHSNKYFHAVSFTIYMVCRIAGKELISGALANPEQPASQQDHEMKVIITQRTSCISCRNRI